MEEALKRDPNSAFLWPRWPSGSCAPISRTRRWRRPGARWSWRPTRSPHLTLAELLRGAAEVREAEAELERAIALSPVPRTPISRWRASRSSRRPSTGRARCSCVSPSGSRASPRPSSSSGGSPSRPSRGTRRSPASSARSSSIPTTTAPGPRSATSTRRSTSRTRRSRCIGARSRSNPDNPAFVERLGDLLIRLGRLQEAQAEIEALCRGAPRDPRVWMKLGAVFYEQKVWDRPSRRSARRAARAVQPPRALLPGHHLHGRRQGRRGRVELERILRRSALDRRARPARLPARPGQALRRGDRGAARGRQPRAARPELFLYLGTAYFRAKQYDRAAETLQEGLALDDKHKDLHFQLGVVFEKQQVRRGGRRLPPRHRARSQARRGLQLRRLHVRRARPEPRRGGQLINKALDLEPENGYFIDSLGWATTSRAGMPRRSASSSAPSRSAKEDPVIFEHLGDAYVKNGFDEDAARRVGEVPAARPGRRRRPKKLEDAQVAAAPGQGERSKASQ